MGLASQYCPVCGGPFETFDLYDDTTGIGNEDDCWASVLSERDIQWVEKYRLVGRTRCIEDFCEDKKHDKTFNIPENHSNIDGLFISDYASHMWGEGYIFILNNAEYRVFHAKPNGDVLFPIHEACISVVQNVLRDRNQGIPTSKPCATLETFYHSLCKQYKRNVAAPWQNGYGLSGLEWDHNYYGARDLQGYNDWEGCHGDEWYCANPINIPDLTTFVLSLLPQISNLLESPNAQELHVSTEAPTTSEEPRLEGLPTEILLHISTFLPISSVFALRLSSKTLASRLYLDQQFWFQHLLSGSLIPYLWDLESKALHAKNQNAKWDWKALAKLLARKDTIMMGKEGMADVPIGLRNRCRIWKIIEGAFET